MKFYVTRHGQTAWNRENLVCGITDLPLDETGREQARQTAQKLKDTHLDRVIVSPLLRARQTAELICQGRTLPLSIDARVREQNYGIYEGVSRFDQGFLSHKRSFATRYPGGESHMSTAVRVYSFLEDTARNCPGESVLVVCHGGICRIIESYFHDMTNEEFSSSTWATARCGSTSWSCPKERGERHGDLLRLPHLRRLPGGQGALCPKGLFRFPVCGNHREHR